MVTLPHTCNAIDGQSSSMYKGNTYYKTTFNAVGGKSYLLYVARAGQVSEVLLNNVQLAKHYGGYTGFFVKLDQAIEGTNELLIKCNNQRDLTNIPVSADFNFNNGLYGDVYIISSGSIMFSNKFGRDRYHLSQWDIKDNLAQFKIESELLNTSGKVLDVVVSITVKDALGVVAVSGTYDIPLGESYALDKSLSISNPHLWNGVKDPYLYAVEIKVSYENKVIDTLTGKVGFRYFSMSKDTGFSLNGQLYPLRGVSLHQDYTGSASAMTKEEYDVDYANVMDIGATVVRLAHYPHDKYAFDRCDELGLIVQTEIPWVNECGVNATNEYFAHIKENMGEMIRNLYNHTCIVFWGMSNELGGSHAGYPQGSYDPVKAKTWQNELYAYSKPLDTTRYIGYVTDRSNQTDWDADWVGMNIYKGWYGGQFSDFGGIIGAQRQKNFMAVTEYGAGANPNTHSDDPMTTTNTGSGGQRHDEEYQNLYHESYIEQIAARPWIQFTSIWAMNDFAVAGRNEGGIPYINDKGIITRDRQVKKDSYYLYKAVWNTTPMVYISSRRFTERSTSGIKIKVYSNCDSVALYQNRVLKQTLTAPSKIGVVFEFNEVPFTALSDTFKVVGTKGEVEVSDEVVFKTTTIAGAISVSKDALSIKPGESGSFTINTDTEYTIVQTGDFFTYVDNNKEVTVTVNSGVTEASSGKLVISTAADSVEVSITAQVIAELTAIQIVGSTAISTSTKYSVNYTPSGTIKTGVTWSIASGSQYASIDQEGNLTVIGSGLVTIKATSVHDANITATLDVTITIAMKCISFDFTGNQRSVLTNAVVQDLQNAEMEAIFSCANGTMGFGSRTSGSSNDRFALSRNANRTYNAMFGTYATGDGGFIDQYKKYKVVLNKDGCKTTDIETGEEVMRTYTNSGTIATQNTAPFSIGLIYNNGNKTYIGGNTGTMKVAYVIIREAGVVTHDFRPYQEGSDFGLMDTVTNQKYSTADYLNSSYSDF